jgi:hypothetical protein
MMYYYEQRTVFLHVINEILLLRPIKLMDCQTALENHANFITER